MDFDTALHIGIDASNIKQGGGLTHLSKLILAADPCAMNFKKITIWSSKNTLNKLPDREWLNKQSPSWMSAPYPRRLIGQLLQLPKEIKKAKCDVLFAPGGIVSKLLPMPTVTMSQNLLPFEKKEASRFGKTSKMYFKFKVLKFIQKLSFKNASGVIFLSNYAQEVVSKSFRSPLINSTIIAHGIEKRFSESQGSKNITERAPIKLLYVSIVMPYKHQCCVAKAVQILKSNGIAVDITFIGAACGTYGKQFRQLIKQLDPNENYLHWIDEQKFETIHEYYKKANIFVFASSCENLPNILIEAMASGLAIACADKNPMTEVLGDAGLYFNPEDPQSIARSIKELILNQELRKKLSELAHQKGKNYSWEKCAHETFKFIRQTAIKNTIKSQG